MRFPIYLIVVAVFSQHHYRTFNVLISHDCITILCHIWMDQAICAVYLFINRGRSAAQRAHVHQRWSRSVLRRGWRMHRGTLLHTFGVFALCGFVSAICPLFEWNVPVLPMARRSRAPQTSGPYALRHPFPPTSDTPGCIIQSDRQQSWQWGQNEKLHSVHWALQYIGTFWIIIIIIISQSSLFTIINCQQVWLWVIL